MTATIIKNGTVVTADLTYKADVKFENGVITEIGPNLSGGDELDATGCYVMPGGIDPHTHLEMPFMGTYSSDDFESGTRAALSGGTTMVVDFALPSPGRSCGPASPNGCTNSSTPSPSSAPWRNGVRCRCGRGSAVTSSAAALPAPPM